uniref:Uncharacterized protein n=1 Tax=Caenorhabditis japonica TaxID=281687 RepID=A0A8R1EKQ1_CAEJA
MSTTLVIGAESALTFHSELPGLRVVAWKIQIPGQNRNAYLVLLADFDALNTILKSKLEKMTTKKTKMMKKMKLVEDFVAAVAVAEAADKKQHFNEVRLSFLALSCPSDELIKPGLLVVNGEVINLRVQVDFEQIAK